MVNVASTLWARATEMPARVSNTCIAQHIFLAWEQLANPAIRSEDKNMRMRLRSGGAF